MAGLGYRLPGTRIEEVTQPSSIATTTSQRTPCFIGLASGYIKVEYEAVVRSSTGLADNLVYTTTGIHDILQVGSQKGLSDYIEGTDFNLTANQIVWTGGSIVTVGATYYVTYEYNRKYDSDHMTDTDLNDYRYKEFTQYEDVTADLGDDLPANTLVMIAKVALRYFGIPKIAVVQVPTMGSTTVGAALELIKYRDVQTVVALSTSSAIRTLVNTHVTERSLPDNARYRMAWFGAEAATPVGDEDDADSIRGLAHNLANELCVFVNATRGLYYYNDPDTKEELSTVIQGDFIAAVLAAYRDSFVYPCTTLINRTVAGIELYDEDYDDYYSEYQLTLCGGSSVFIVESIGGVMRVVDDLTTDNSTVEKNNINIITAKHYIAKDIAYQLTRTFVGRLILDSGSYTNTVHAYLAAIFSAYKQANIIEKVTILSAAMHATQRDTVVIHYAYTAIYTNKKIDGTYALVV